MNLNDTTDELQQAPAPSEAPLARKVPRVLWLVMAALGLALLSGAAYLGARLLTQPPAQGGFPHATGVGPQGSGPQTAMQEAPPGASGSAPVISGSNGAVKFIPAPEIPQTQADVSGLLADIKDRSLFVRLEGGPSLSSVDEDGSTGGSGGAGSPASGTITEVVVTGETKIYQDRTFEEVSPDDSEVQQVIEPLELSELADGAQVMAWGQKRGDRLIAEVILYTRPVG